MRVTKFCVLGPQGTRLAQSPSERDRFDAQKLTQEARLRILRTKHMELTRRLEEVGARCGADTRSASAAAVHRRGVAVSRAELKTAII